MTSQEFFRLVSECGRLASEVTAANDLERAFKSEVAAMLDGSGPPVSPQTVETYTEAIERARDSETEARRRLAAKMKPLVEEVARTFVVAVAKELGS
jgi:hypothetical protein